MSSKVVFIGLSTYGSIGGLQAFNRRVVRVLADHAVKTCRGRPSIVLRGDTEADMPQEIAADFLPSAGSTVRLARNCLKSVRGADLIIFGHVNLLPMLAVCRLAAPRAKTALMVHGVEVWGDPPHPPLRGTDRFLLRRLDRVISVSAFTVRRMMKSSGLPETRFRVFRNAVEPMNFTPVENRPAMSLLSVSRLAEHDTGKNIDKILRAVAKLAPRYPDLTYTHVGDGMLRPELQALAAELGIGDRVIFAGRVSDEELARAYEQASVFVLPSEKEGFGIVFLEAWQRRIPVICGTEDAAHEVVSDGSDGYAVDPHDINKLAERIEYLICNPQEASRMGIAGQEKVRRSYLMASYSDQLCSLVEELLP